MTHPAPTFNQIRAKVQAVRHKIREGKIPDARAIGIQIPGVHSGDFSWTDGAETYRVQQCDSSLAARALLLDQDPSVRMTVLLTRQSPKELGEDVVVRLAGRTLY